MNAQIAKLPERPGPKAAAARTPEFLASARKAMALYDVEGWIEAVALLRDALEAAPDDAACRAALAEVYSYWGFRREISGLHCEDDYRMAFAEAQRALRLAPERSDCHRAMALALRRGEWANAERRREEVLAALDLDASDGETWHEYWRVRGYGLDDPCLQKALELGPSNCGLLIDVGVVACERGRLEQARASLVAALHANPRNALALYDLAMVLDRQGEPDRALQALRRGLALHPGDPLLEAGLERFGPAAPIAPASAGTAGLRPARGEP